MELRNYIDCKFLMLVRIEILLHNYTAVGTELVSSIPLGDPLP